MYENWQRGPVEGRFSGGSIPLMPTKIKWHCTPTGRGNRLKSGKVWVRIPSVPPTQHLLEVQMMDSSTSISSHVPQLAEEADSKSVKCGFDSHRGYQF